MTAIETTLLRLQRLVQRAQMPRPDMERQQAEVRQGVRFIKEELRQPPVPLPQIAADTGSHYVAVGVIAAANLRLHMINRQGGERELHSAVHASMLVAHKDLFAFHDGPVS